ncbi:formimidoylglutamase [Mangrovivirga cuniculi]|uniref:formimidoylglutamase n=1 Tax=Mangrovivirga cuniculi TaxID=2715131 RepID=UPI001FE5E1DF|nr:formimidoylglutamase [Mangrovivirga cuniculi]
MTDLSLFFDPVSESLYENISDRSSFFFQLTINNGKAELPDDCTIALIGLTENRGAENSGSIATAADEIRKKLYNLKKGAGPYSIMDLGNLRNGQSYDETSQRLSEVGRVLIENNILPVFIGGSHDLDYGQYQSYEGLEKLISVCAIDRTVDMSGDKEQASEHRHIQNIVIHEPNYLFNFTLLGYQSYLIDQTLLNTLEKLHFDTFRLGYLRSDIKEIEPIVREADMMSFDLTAIKSADFPGVNNAQPFGLTGEEACQVCWYAGLNEKLSSVGFYGYDPSEDDKNMKSAMVSAVMIWYFIEGVINRKEEQNFKTNDYLKFVVPIGGEPDQMVFIRVNLQIAGGWRFR